LAFVNTIRHESAYLVIGITDKPRQVLGVPYLIEARYLQDKVKDRCNLVPRFSVYPFDYQGKTLCVIEIPVVKYPFPCVAKSQEKANFLEKNIVYYRKDDKNEEADQLEIKRINQWLDSLPEGLTAFPSLERYLEKTKTDYQKLQEYFVHLRGRQIAEVSLLAKEIGTLNPREDTVQRLCELVSQKERRMIVLGEPGMGKSTSLKYMTYKLAERFENFGQPTYHQPLPIYLELRSATDDVLALVCDVLTSSFRTLRAETLKNIVIKLLEEGAFILFFDGLNEIVKDKNQQVISHLKDFFNKYKNCMFVISSRPEENRTKLHSIPTFELLPMDAAQQQEFLEKNTNLAETKELINNTKKQYPDLQNFTGVPFLLLLLIRVVERTKEVPKFQTEIIEKFLQGLYELEQEKNFNFLIKETQSILEHLAKMIVEKHENNPKLPKQVLVTYIKAKLEEAHWQMDISAWIAKMVELNVLITEQEYYSFRHQLFLESLYAAYLKNSLTFD
jgi:hypothetical protein